MTEALPLPRVGAPAQRALATVGVTGLADLVDHRPEDLLKLHGMGPKAIGLLRTALRERGLSFRGES
jgi:hypothetical protein